ncbi:MAG: cytochrome P450 [Deltaproteobacteria bacterium]|nr:cytochrome P450 [Deltaproteobacteria bacterium]
MSPVDPLLLVDPQCYAEHGYPHEAWAKLRKEAPVHHFEPAGWSPFWAITKHEHIVEVSKQPLLFLNGPGMTFVPQRDGEVQEQIPIRTIINMDPPDHKKFRKVVSSYFTPRAVGALSGLVEQTARDLVDGMGEEGECDFMTEIASLHPLRVIARILGVPESDEPFILRLTNELFGNADPEFQRDPDRMEAMKSLFMEFWEYFGRIMKDRRANPKNDLASVIANAQIDGEPMGELETMGYCLIAFTAGHETTRGSIGGGLKALIDHPDAFHQWANDPELTPLAIDEIVRYVTPVNHMVRTAAEDYELGGSQIHEGDKLVLFYASANRDEEIFDDPEVLRIDRDPNRHLGFGIGEHFCVGANLARMTSGTLFRELVGRIEEVELAGEPERIASNLVPGFKHMRIRYRLRASARAA